MLRRMRWMTCWALLLGRPDRMAAGAVPVVVCPPNAAPRQQLAAKEIARYVYLRTGALPAIVGEMPARGSVIVLATDPALGAEAYALRTDGAVTRITGGDAAGALYGAYRFAEVLGVRFYLHGDVVPDERLAQLPAVHETGRPLFALRGVNPWGSHPFGCDAWDANDYKALCTQLAKLRMNFLGLHCYPEGQPYAEPTVWLGTAGDFDAQGRVTFSYPAHYYNTLATGPWGPIPPLQTSAYHFGGALLFADDAWAPAVLRGFCPAPVAPADCNAVFNRTAAQFRDAFNWARRLGVQTCLGTETPLRLPAALAQRLSQVKQAQPAQVRAVYEGTFRRIAASHPLDYYWLWTPEGWTWESNQAAQYADTVADARLAMAALRAAGAPFRLATCGWVLGPAHDRAAFDRDLPKDLPMAALSRDTGAAPLEPAFGRIAGRAKWAIPWLESDNRPGLAALQLEVGRLRRDAADARAYGCTGLLGLHWRTELIAPNIAALAQAAWDQAGWNPAPGRAPGVDATRRLACEDFYADWAQANFGLAAAGRIFTALDGRVPQVTDGGCPSGRLTPERKPWSAVAPQFAFVDEFAAFRPRVRGAGNLDRFDYWLNTFQYLRALAQLRCALAQTNAAELTRLWREAYRCLLATVNSPGALAMVVNMEQHPGWGPLVARSAAPPWPQTYQGEPRIIVPCVRSVIGHGEPAALTVLVLDNQPPRSVRLCWRPLGGAAWQQRALTSTGRARYRVALPAADDFEYHLAAETAGGRQLIWPATAPEINQTVVVWGER